MARIAGVDLRATKRFMTLPYIFGTPQNAKKILAETA